MSTSKKVVLVTGGNSGIGFELCNQLLSKGNYHIFLASRSLDKGKAAVKDLESRSLLGTVEVIELDVTNDNNIDAAFKHVESIHGKLDVLVNNAGIGSDDAISRDSLQQSFNANATGPAVLTSVFAPLLKKSATPNSPARIVNVGTGGSSVTMRLDPNGPGAALKLVPYRVSKCALNMVTACQVAEYRDDGIKVFLYNPGFTVSNLGPRNNAESGAKPTAEAVWPLVEIVEGMRDDRAGENLFHSDKVGFGVHPW